MICSGIQPSYQVHGLRSSIRRGKCGVRSTRPVTRNRIGFGSNLFSKSRYQAHPPLLGSFAFIRHKHDFMNIVIVVCPGLYARYHNVHVGWLIVYFLTVIYMYEFIWHIVASRICASVLSVTIRCNWRQDTLSHLRNMLSRQRETDKIENKLQGHVIVECSSCNFTVYSYLYHILDGQYRLTSAGIERALCAQ